MSMSMSMSSSSHSSMEIKVLSADDLRLAERRPGKAAAFFVTVRTGSRVHEQASTDASDRHAHPRGRPSWNQELNLPLPPLATSVTLEVHCGSATAASRAVASVSVPLSDFAGVGPEGHLHLLSYRLRDERGEPNGIINFSARVFGVAARRHMEGAPAVCWTGLYYHKRQRTAGGVAVGYPLGYGNRVGMVSSK